MGPSKTVKQLFLSRIVGLGGETIEIKDGKIYINGKVAIIEGVQDIYYYNRGKHGGKHGGIGEVVLIPKDHIFLLGDNSKSSMDSRHYGFIPEEKVVGKVVFMKNK